MIDQSNKLKQEKEQEMKLVQAKFEKQVADLKAQFKKDQDFLISEHTKKVTVLEEDLKIARQGFEAERNALEKKRTDMQAQYERQIEEMERSHSE
jgi:hypothetical protein